MGMTNMESGLQPEWIGALRAAVDRGWEDIEAGRFVDIDLEDLDAAIAEVGEQAVTDGGSAG